MWLSTAFAALLLLLPAACNVPRSVTYALAGVLALLQLANLLYYRTYFTAIPLESYRLAGNLRDFLPAVRDSLRPPDLALPLATLLAGLLSGLRPRRKVVPAGRKRYFVLLATAGMLCYGSMLFHGGFRGHYEHVLAGHRSHVCAVPECTLLGAVCYDALRERVRYTPALCREIETFLADAPRQSAPAFAPDATPAEAGPKRSSAPRPAVVVVLLESFESWLLEREVAGVEITPCLNGLLRDEGVLYAPKVLTQVKGGRSIDAQLLINAGLLPLDNGAYSACCPGATYPSLIEAFRKRHPGARAYAFTPDCPAVWNQQAVARSFGFDRLFACPDLRRSGISQAGRIDDGELFERCCALLDSLTRPDSPDRGNDALWVQCITYSGHVPFRIPEHLRNVEFPGEMPEKLRSYLTAAHYTDSALGDFIRRLRRMPALAEALVVVTGDHEGLAADRAALAACDAGRGAVSDEPFTPLIILGAPVTLRYEEVMGQIDIYPTLRDLLGLDGYFWSGLGHSIVRPGAPPAAADPHLRIAGDTLRLTPRQARRLEQAWRVSDRMIRSDYFGHLPGQEANGRTTSSALRR